MFFSKIKKYSTLEGFYRILHRVVSKLNFHPAYLWRKYLFGHAIIEINSLKMFLDLQNDSGLSRFLMIHGKREPVTFDYLLNSQVLNDGDVALDIGANIGYYALQESKLVGERGSVYAIEPVISNLNILDKNVSLNGLNNIQTFHFAIGDRKQVVKIFTRANKNLSSLTELSSDYGEVVGIEEVPMITVDDFVGLKMNGKIPSYIRMDVEGYELNILEGMKETLSLCPCLQIEFHPTILTNEQKDRICELLHINGYSKAVITDNPKPKLSSVLRWLNKKMGVTYHEEGKLSEGDINYLRKMLSSSQRIFNAFIS